jgi:hypothetical protein
MTKKTLAGLLLLGFALSLGYAFASFPRQRSVPPAGREKPRRTSSPAGETVSHSPQIAPSGEQASVREYTGFKTDLFRPLFEKPPAPPKPKPHPPVAREKTPLPPPPEPIMPPAPPVAKRLASFTYLGQVNKGAQRSIFLKEKGRIFIVDVGDDFGEKNEFRLVQVTEKEIRIETAELSDLIRIPLQEKKPLEMGAPALSMNRTPRNSLAQN